MPLSQDEEAHCDRSVAATFLPQTQLVDRMDAGYWHPRYRVLDALFAGDAAEWVTLGDLEPFMTYGAVASGDRPEPDAQSTLVRIDPKALQPTGLDLSKCVRIPEGSKWDIPRARVRKGDLLFVRSGVASLGRTAVFDLDDEAVVGCFVDIVRQDARCPYYVCAFLHSEIGMLQIERLKSGVGTVNMNFDEIKSLVMPLFDEETQSRVSEHWRTADEKHREALDTGASVPLAEAKRLQTLATEPFNRLLPGGRNGG